MSRPISTCIRFGSCCRPNGSLQDVPSGLPCHTSCRERTRHLPTVAPGPLRSSKSHQNRCHAERPVLQLTNCPEENEVSCWRPNSITPRYPSALPSSTTHRLILSRVDIGFVKGGVWVHEHAQLGRPRSKPQISFKRTPRALYRLYDVLVIPSPKRQRSRFLA